MHRTHYLLSFFFGDLNFKISIDLLRSYLVKMIETDVSIGEQYGSPQATSWAEISASALISSGTKPKHQPSILLNANLRLASACFFSSAASGRNMILFLVQPVGLRRLDYDTYFNFVFLFRIG